MKPSQDTTLEGFSMSSYRMKYKIGATQYHIPVVDDISGFGSGIPLGTILPYSANTLNPPYGFLFCDGSAISRAMYPDLFDLIGTLYGLGDGSTTFNLPDLTSGKFLEGTNSAGTSKSAGLPNITASNGNGYNLLVGAGGIDSGSYSGAFYAEGKGYGAYGGAVDSTYPPYSSQLRFDAARCSSIYGNNFTIVYPNNGTA